MEKELLDALQSDLSQEYGLAIRYLGWSNQMRELKQPQIGEILLNLSKDCVSHSEYIRDILTQEGKKPVDEIRYFKTDFKDIKLALQSCFYLENRMAKEYSELAQDMGEESEYYETFVQLANWETMHMYHVMSAIKLSEGLEKAEGVKRSREKLVEQMKKLTKDLPKFDNEQAQKMLIPEKVSQDQAKFESTLSEALEKARQLGKSIAGMDKIKHEESKMKDLGTPAEEMMEESAVKVIFREKKNYGGYCFKCSEHHNILNPEKIVLAGDKPAVKGQCEDCGFTMFTTDV